MAYTTIPKPSAFFTPKLYTGNGSSQTITGLNFQPDLTWIKVRDDTESNGLYDAVRGALYRIQSNSTSVSTSVASTVTGWTSDGFSLGADNEVNGNGKNYVGWNWKANGLGSSNTDGSINTTYTSASTTSGFSISTYTGTGANATVGHGLGAVPKMIIVKRLDVTSSWRCYHASLGNTKNIVLNTTAAEATSSTMWNNTSPTSTTFSLGSYDEVNGSSAPHVAYCFAEIPGFSKFGLYEGNGNFNGPFVYTGFKPSFIMVKAKGQTESWYINDNKRPGYNTNNYYLNPNTNSAEGTSTTLATGLLSNGFKPFNTDTSMNTSGQGYVYMAFAENPLVSTNGNAATAR